MLYGSVFHALSLASSSFVEEEHQTWYFLTMTTLLVAMATVCRNRIMQGIVKKVDNKVPPEEHYGPQVRELKTSNDEEHDQTLFCEQRRFSSKSFKNVQQNKKGGNLNLLNLIHWQDCAGVTAIMLLARLLRMMNQTGNKWLDVADVGDWLVRYDI